jgi:thioredoxin reductase (NADPH)
MTEALVLTKYANSVTIVHRREELAASEVMQREVFDKEKEGEINFLWDSEVVEMVGENSLEKVRIKTKKGSKKTRDIKGEEKGDGYIYWEKDIDGVFVAIGHAPATDVFSNQIELDEKGYVKKEKSGKYKMSTSKEGVFVAGDVHDYHYRQAVTAAGFGCMAGMEALDFLDKSTPSW